MRVRTMASGLMLNRIVREGFNPRRKGCNRHLPLLAALAEDNTPIPAPQVFRGEWPAKMETPRPIAKPRIQ